MNFHRSPNTFIGHVHLTVSDLKRSLTFYTETLGFRVLEETDNKVTLSTDNQTPLIIIEQEEKVLPKQQRTTGLYHFAILVPNRRDLGAFIRHISESGYPVQGASDHLFSEAVYLADPDGHGIEVYVDRPESEWVWKNGELPFISDPLDIDSLLKESGDKEWSGFPNKTVLGHIHLHVADLNTAKIFYNEGLGFDITVPFRHQALFVSSGRYHHHIGLNTWNGQGAPAPGENHVRMNWYSIVLPSEEVRSSIIERLVKIGASIHKENGSVWIKDPSHNKIRLDLA
ncbi:VOC family protein [Pseudalkalibacillus decolorationis]|uniref:VOC family protein n=1 Tax=Pseudalkalibacillus decolorationis TaxID=163879 RepID=UPI002148A075|nr:VOC family protein [Pseudalkalibacillus decolorationis]